MARHLVDADERRKPISNRSDRNHWWTKDGETGEGALPVVSIDGYKATGTQTTLPD